MFIINKKFKIKKSMHNIVNKENQIVLIPNNNNKNYTEIGNKKDYLPISV